MRKNYFLTLLMTLCLTSLAFGQVILAEGFDYADGSLVPNGGGPVLVVMEIYFSNIW